MYKILLKARIKRGNICKNLYTLPIQKNIMLYLYRYLYNNIKNENHKNHLAPPYHQTYAQTNI